MKKKWMKGEKEQMNMKKILGILAVLAILAVVCVGAAGADEPDGKWTESGNYSTAWYNIEQSTFTISTAEDLAGLAYLVNNGTSFANKTINIVNDISLEGHLWVPINEKRVYNLMGGVTLNGNGKKITNMVIEYPPKDDDKYDYGVGFIGRVDGGTTIKNITFSNCRVVNNSGSQVSVIIGMSYNDITLKNVNVENCEVKGVTKTGAFVGQNDDGTVELISCSLKDTKVYANYSYALFVGLLNDNSDGVIFSDVTADEKSLTVWKDGEFEKEGVEINGRYYYLYDNKTLYLTEPQNAWAEGREKDAKLEYIGVEYPVNGSIFVDGVAKIKDGNVTKIYSSIGEAVDAATEGQTVTLIKDVIGLESSVKIEKSITVIGEAEDNNGRVKIYGNFGNGGTGDTDGSKKGVLSLGKYNPAQEKITVVLKNLDIYNEDNGGYTVSVVNTVNLYADNVSFGGKYSALYVMVKTDKRYGGGGSEILIENSDLSAIQELSGTSNGFGTLVVQNKATVNVINSTLEVMTRNTASMHMICVLGGYTVGEEGGEKASIVLDDCVIKLGDGAENYDYDEYNGVKDGSVVLVKEKDGKFEFYNGKYNQVKHPNVATAFAEKKDATIFFYQTGLNELKIDGENVSGRTFSDLNDHNFTVPNVATEYLIPSEKIAAGTYYESGKKIEEARVIHLQAADVENKDISKGIVAINNNEKFTVNITNAAGYKPNILFSKNGKDFISSIGTVVRDLQNGEFTVTPTEKGIWGIYADFSDTDALVETTPVEYKYVYLGTVEVVDSATEDVAKIGDVGYVTLWAAVNAAQNGDTITLLKDVDANVVVGADKNITLDLNGKTINGKTVANSPAITNYGNLKITDNSTGTAGTIKREDTGTNGYYVIDNGGLLEIDKVTVTNGTGDGSVHAGASLIRNGELDGTDKETTKIVINGGNLNQNNFNVIKNGGINSVIEVNGGVISSSVKYAILSYGKVYINGGNVTGPIDIRGYKDGNESNSAIVAISRGNINSTIYAEQYPGHHSENKPNVTITGGNFGNSTEFKVGEGNGTTFTESASLGTILIKGGIFEKEPESGYIVGGYSKCLNKDNKWMVTPIVMLTPESPITYGAKTTPSIDIEVGEKEFNYSTTPFGAGTKWTDTTSASLNVGTYYVYAKYGDNKETNRAELIVNRAKYQKPSEITVDATGNTVKVRIASEDRAKTLEYGVVTTGEPETWKPVTKLDENGSFALTGLDASASYTVYVRQAASMSGNYEASDPVSQSFTSPAVVKYTVKFNANGGVGAIDDNVVDAGSKVTKPSSNQISRAGYKFNQWTTDIAGDHPVTFPLEITADTTLYAQWTGKSYNVVYETDHGTTPDPVQFTNGGSSNTLDKIADEGSYVFSGWATTKGGPVVYMGGQNINPVIDSGNLKLYAVWEEQTYEIRGSISGVEAGTVDLILMKGVGVFAELKDKTFNDSFKFEKVPAGLYNIVAEHKNGDKVDKTVTISIQLSGTEDDISVKFPEENVNSKVTVKTTNDTPAVVVGGLEKEAKDHAKPGSTVNLDAIIESKVVADVPEDTTGLSADKKKEIEAEQKTQNAIKKIIEERGEDKTFRFHEVTVKETVITGTESKTSTLTQTSNVLELGVSNEMPDKEINNVLRYHGDMVQVFEKLDEKPGEGNLRDLTYYIGSEVIYLYSSKYSTFAIEYTGGDTPGPTPTQSSSSTITVFHGTAATYDGIILFDRSTVVTSAELPGATSAKVTPISTRDDGWYTFKLDADGFAGNGTVWFQVPLDVIAVKDMTEMDVSLFDCDTVYLSKDGRYAYYKASVAAAGTYTIGFEAGAAKTETAEPVIVDEPTPIDVPVAPVTPQPTATPAPFVAVLAGLGAATVLLKRRH